MHTPTDFIDFIRNNEKSYDRKFELENSCFIVSRMRKVFVFPFDEIYSIKSSVRISYQKMLKNFLLLCCMPYRRHIYY